MRRRRPARLLELLVELEYAAGLEAGAARRTGRDDARGILRVQRVRPGGAGLCFLLACHGFDGSSPLDSYNACLYLSFV